jgi:hypothetical protein
MNTSSTICNDVIPIGIPAPAAPTTDFFTLSGVEQLQILHDCIEYSVAYLSAFDFEPHEGGNAYTCGLHTPHYWGQINSNITIGDDDTVWRFVDFNSERTRAIYVNKDRQFIKIDSQHNDPKIVRMQVARETSLPAVVERYIGNLIVDTPVDVDVGFLVSGEPAETTAPLEVRDWLNRLYLTAYDVAKAIRYAEPDMDGTGYTVGGGYSFSSEDLGVGGAYEYDMY